MGDLQHLDRVTAGHQATFRAPARARKRSLSLLDAMRQLRAIFLDKLCVIDYEKLEVYRLAGEREGLRAGARAGNLTFTYSN